MLRRLLLAALVLLTTPAQAATDPIAEGLAAGAVQRTGDASNTTVQVPSAPTSNADTLAAWWKDFLNVHRFRHPGDPDDTLSFNRMCAYAQTLGNSIPKQITIPTGNYSVAPTSTTTPVCTLTGSYWDIAGRGQSSIINMTADGELFRFDISTITANDNRVHDFRTISNLGSGNQTHTNVIRLYCATPGSSPCQAATFYDFTNLYASGVYQLVQIDQTSYTSYGGGGQIQNYGHLHFYNLNTDSSTGLLPYNVVHFDGGPGAHDIYQGGTWGATNASLSIGNCTDGLGDQLIEGTHFINGLYGVYICGPTNLAYYRDNWTIIGNQFDGITTNTVYATNLESSRIDNNNSTSVVGISCAGCSLNNGEDRFYAKTRNGTPATGFPSGTSTKSLFDIFRVPADGSALNAAVEIHLFCTGVIGTVGDVEVDGTYIVEFTSTSTSTIRTLYGGTPVGPGASYLSLSIASSGSTRAATLTWSTMKFLCAASGRKV